MPAAKPRTYNQDHVARPYTKGQRRISIYWTWSYAWESQRDVAELDNRFSTMTEVRRVAWPAYEGPEWGSANFLQGIAGTLELFHRSALSFQTSALPTFKQPAEALRRRLVMQKAPCYPARLLTRQPSSVFSKTASLSAKLAFPSRGQPRRLASSWIIESPSPFRGQPDW